MSFYKNTEQISEICDYKFNLPKYGKSTTDPTYYEPAATRIANMKKSSGVILEGIYDFYSKDDVSKFNEENFSKNIKNAYADPKYIKGITREEVSQVTNQLAEKVDDVISDNKKAAAKKNARIQENIEINDAINQKNAESNSENNSTE